MHSQARTLHQIALPQDQLPRKRSLSPAEDDEADGATIDVRTVSLASRKQLCVNEKLKSKTVDLDEACRQRLGGEHGCNIMLFHAKVITFRERRQAMSIPPSRG